MNKIKITFTGEMDCEFIKEVTDEQLEFLKEISRDMDDNAEPYSPTLIVEELPEDMKPCGWNALDTVEKCDKDATHYGFCKEHQEIIYTALQLSNRLSKVKVQEKPFDYMPMAMDGKR